jgi:halocyanin-like protein
MDERRRGTTRRGLLRAGAVVGVAAVAGCSGGGGTAGAAGAPYDGWLDDTPNFDGTVADRTDGERVTVVVGAGNGLAFDPPAVEVRPGTTVVWEWTGRGGQHNVQAESGAFESELASAAGTTFERTFDDPGVVRYLCLPHQAVGMRGVVDVVD